MIFAIGRISRFEFSITDAENFFKWENIQKNWGTFKNIGSPFLRLGKFSKLGNISKCRSLSNF